MDCDAVRTTLHDYQEGRLPAAAHQAVRAHLESCPACAHAGAVERELTSVLEHQLPQYPASLALKRRIAARWPVATPPRSRWARWRPWLVPALAVLAVGLVAAPVLYVERTAGRATSVRTAMVAEAVNDHLRVLSSARPLEIESGGLHQVKPWFEGRLDFAPVVSFEGDADFPLKGGAVGYFLDRKAAVLVYAYRLHPISLLVFRADGLRWPATGESALTTQDRGFNVVMWRHGGLGYALVSDADARTLAALAQRLQAQP
jgi:anti-sigma factor RsiW